MYIQQVFTHIYEDGDHVYSFFFLHFIVEDRLLASQFLVYYFVPQA